MPPHAMTSSGLPAFTQHSFARTPNVKKPRSTFDRSKPYKTTLNAGLWIPVFLDEILPGDTLKLDASIFARLLSPLSVPIMDNMYMDWIAIYAPNRILWEHFVNQMGEQATPTSSIDYLTPVITFTDSNQPVGSLTDYFGIPLAITVADLDNDTVVNALPYRMYNLFISQWVIAQNIVDSPAINTGDGPDLIGQYPLANRMKRPDYFTSCQPNTQKGNPPQITITGTINGNNEPMYFHDEHSHEAPIETENPTGYAYVPGTTTGDYLYPGVTASPYGSTGLEFSGFGFVLNDFRLLATTQQFLELDERGGTRYPEMIFNHFGVQSSDARLQRVEFLGAGTVPIMTHVVPQTSVTAATPQANLAAFTSASGRCGFTHSFEEHGWVMVLIEIRADLTYQQGLHKMWSRQTRYDYYDPLFANIGEQPVLIQEIYATGGNDDPNTFGYQEYAAEYRFGFGQVTGLMRYGVTDSVAVYNLSQYFSSEPALNPTFLNDNPPIQRICAVEDEPEFIFDSFWKVLSTRVMPTFSIPGLYRI